MAAVTELSFLLFALINCIHAQERIFIKEEGYSYTFNLPENTNSCLISRSVGEEKLVLWNTSDLWSNNPSVPKDLKQRLVSSVKTSSYTILDLTHSDSGRYREECWTDGNVMHDNNFTITVCTTSLYGGRIRARLGEPVDLPCKGAADNLDIQWLKQDSRYEEETWSRVFGDNTTSVMDNVRGRYQVVTNTSALRVSNLTATDFRDYICLVMNQQQCVSSHTLELGLKDEVIYRSVGETAVLPCPITDSTDEQPPRWQQRSVGLSGDFKCPSQGSHSREAVESGRDAAILPPTSAMAAAHPQAVTGHPSLSVCPTSAAPGPWPAC